MAARIDEKRPRLLASARRWRIKRRLRRFILDELLERPFHGDDPLAAGEVDSLAHEQLVDYIEQAFGVRLTDEEMVEENFESIAALAAIIDARR